MNEQIFSIKQNTTVPILTVSIKNKSRLGLVDGIDLNSITAVTFTMKSQCGDMKIYDKQATVVCTGGTIQYNWTQEDTDTYGDFNGEFKLRYLNGDILAIPQIGSIKIKIEKDLNPFD